MIVVSRNPRPPGCHAGHVRALFWFLVVIAVLAVGADRAGDYLAERAVAAQVRDSQDLRHTPDVDVTGFPFLTQLARQHFDRVADEHDRRLRRPWRPP